MSSSDRNVNITVRDNRGLATLVGFVTVLVLSRLWWTGLLADMCATAYAPEGDGMSSVSYTIVAFVANLIYGVGTVLVMAWSGLWWVISDVANGFRQWSAERQTKQGVTDSATDAAMQSEASSAVLDTNSDELLSALQTIDQNVRTTHDEVQAITERLGSIDERVTAIESQPKTTTRTTRARK